MLSKNKIKYIRSLEMKKHRRQEHAFVAEGHKSVGDLLRAGFIPRCIVATDDWRQPTPLPADCELIRATTDELQRASLLMHPQQVIGVFELPGDDMVPGAEEVAEGLVLCLDGVQDPGNLGTIIRTADWFGIRHIVCSPLTADAFAPKVVQATMGSIARVSICYVEVEQWLASLPAGTPVYGTVLGGDNLYDAQLSQHGIIVMGNEGKGISPEVQQRLTHRLLIPSFPPDSPTAESLNVSIATAITLAEFRRQGIG